MPSSRALRVFQGFLAACLIVLPVARYQNLYSAVADLGFFTNHISNFSLFDSQIFFAAYGHFQPFAAVYALFYRLFPDPAALLVLQSLMLLIPLFLLPSDDPATKDLFRTVYLLCFAVWNVALFDFHFDHLLVPLTALFFHSLHRKRTGLAVAAAVAVAMVKEPFALVTCFMGFHLAGRHGKRTWGAFLVLFGAAYFLVATRIIIPAFTWTAWGDSVTDPARHFGGDPLARALHVLTHPWELIRDILATRRFVYLNSIFSAFGYVVVLFALPELIPALPVLGIALLSDFESFHSYRYHYGAGLAIPFFAAFVIGWPRYRAWCSRQRGRWTGFLADRRAALAVVILPVLLSNVFFSYSPLSRFFWKPVVPQYYGGNYLPDPRSGRIKATLERVIPTDPEASVSTQNTLFWGFLAERRYFFLYPDAALTPWPVPRVDYRGFFSTIARALEGDPTLVTHPKRQARFVVIDLKRPLYLKDFGATRERFEESLESLATRYDLLLDEDDLRIYRLKPGFPEVLP